MNLTIKSIGTTKHPFIKIMNGDEEFCSTRNREFALLIQQAFAEIEQNPEFKRPSLDYILDVIYKITNIDLRINTSRKRIHATPRFIYCKIALELGYMLTEIGIQIHKDHASVSYGVKKCSDYYATDHDFRTLFDKISKNINQKT
jgi:chromosomal replication initiation ATPase DnaA